MPKEPDTVSRALREELLQVDAFLIGAWDALRLAQVQYQVAGRKYAAVRDLVVERFGGIPYSLHDFPSQGRFRFFQMPPGEAVVAALRESQVPMTLEALTEVLRKGGSSFTPRTINAAVMQTRGVQKDDEGRYSYLDPVEPEDVPFT